ncbi:hypothetical protein HPB50_023701 [Hyalomma asiaticum]|uniref:Uncharacterized protein n=1 Tax=Hyalomma asiaticum TaxID=266040 RepID=A0ACB7T6I2_HYAAI|nr:hypothetical protein HPB50_023701 [Hyalomma asiaticum]
MEEFRKAFIVVCGIVNVASFFVSLSISWRVWQARDSSVVPFFPLAADVMHLYAWLQWGLTTRRTRIASFYGVGLALMAVNVTVHRLYSSWNGPGLALLGALLVMATASSTMTVVELLKLACYCAVVCKVAAVVRILTYPLPEIAFCQLLVCGLRMLLAVMDRDVWYTAWNVSGAAIAAIEIGVALWN